MDVRKKIESANQKLNAVVTMMEKQPTQNGVLSDVAVAIKDNFSTNGVRTTACCKILDNYVPVFDSAVVEKLKAAGADLVCKATMDELAMGGTGTNYYLGVTHNPYDENRIAGGSSSGSAALVGAHCVDFAIGSDTGDSVRKPASFCGAVGFKPTYGRISRYGVIPYASSLDHVAYFTDTVAQSALMLNVLAGRDDRDMTSLPSETIDYTELDGNLKGKVFGVIDEILNSKKEDEYKTQYLKLLTQLEKQGAIIKHYSMDEKLLRTMLVVYHLIANCESSANHANLDGLRFGHRIAGDNLSEIMTNSRSEGFGSLIKKRFIIGAYGLDDDHQEFLFKKAQQIRRLLVDQYNAILNDCDGVILPAADDVAPLLTDLDLKGDVIIENHLVLGNFAGVPSITVPLGFVSNLPVGVNITSKAKSEKSLLSLALGVERLIDFKVMEKEVNPWITSQQ